MDEKILKVDNSVLNDEESKLCALVTLNCFAVVKNQWSTNEELGDICEKIRGGGTSKIQDYKKAWEKLVEKHGLGDDHNTEPADDCEIKGLHRLCQRKITKKDDGDIIRHESRIHPAFAKKVFSESDVTLKQLSPIPMRFPKKRSLEKLSSANDTLHQKLSESLKLQRKLLTKYKKKLSEIDEVRSEIQINDERVGILKADYLAKEEAFRISRKGRPLETDDEGEPPAKRARRDESSDIDSSHDSNKRKKILKKSARTDRKSNVTVDEDDDLIDSHCKHEAEIAENKSDSCENVKESEPVVNDDCDISLETGVRQSDINRDVNTGEKSYSENYDDEDNNDNKDDKDDTNVDDNSIDDDNSNDEDDNDGGNKIKDCDDQDHEDINFDDGSLSDCVFSD